jgi:hypothetical protein
MAPDPVAIANAMAAQQPPPAGNQPQKVTFVARGVDPEMLELAKKMKKEGGGYNRYGGRSVTGDDKLAEEIWKATGLWEYQPNVWVKEIPDNTASVNAPLPGPEVLGSWRLNLIPGPGEPYTTGRTLTKGPMSQIIQRGPYDELYQLYPELKNIPVEVFDDYIYGGGSLIGGYLQRGTGNVYLGKARNTQSNYEGLSAATDTDQQIRNALANTAVHEVQHIVNILDRLRAEKPNTAYNNRGTEVLARTAEARRNLTEQQRREIPPMYMYNPANKEEKNTLKYKEDTNPNFQSPRRWVEKDVQSSPLLYGVYGVTEPKRSVKKLDPKLAKKY